ncbi:class I SAM-dependent methyltransferase [Rhodanobacter sp. OK091]|uniref:class I SAM-dependent methyltransferase n=1 Tax=Rhodanobacter sp. OK091 TaxID=1881037 RepID=UPI0009249262|nr:class I SAM-dependent methyltransferase [Rhodanobacter sp. OK091]SHM02119.1 Methyltransferase domain-containing protein [Rhodanobacter sp. OK091]
MSLKSFAYRHRLPAKRAIALLARSLPASARRRLLAMAERVAFSVTPQYQSETLPPIFDYWSGRFLAPDAQRLGIDSPESFFFDQIRRSSTDGNAPVRVLSVGTGSCGMEIELAARLHADGIAAQITCADFNPALMRHAAAAAKERGVAAVMTFVTRDCNLPFELPGQDVIIVNQFFHHVTALETFCGSLRRSLAPQGVLLGSDIIGRNGHRLWPDVETVVQEAWATLQSGKRHDRHFNTASERYRPIDHAAYSNEGVRAQDIVGCLLAEFDFELFFSFGGAIMPFVERRIGFNFDPQLAEDRAWIDRMHAIDAAALAAGRYPAANMIAALRHKGSAARAVFEPISPQQHVDLTREQQVKACIDTR